MSLPSLREQPVPSLREQWNQRVQREKEFSQAFFAIPQWLEENQLVEFPLTEERTEEDEGPKYRTVFSPLFVSSYVVESVEDTSQITTRFRELPMGAHRWLSRPFFVGMDLPPIALLEEWWRLHGRRPRNVHPSPVVLDLPDRRQLLLSPEERNKKRFRATLLLPGDHPLTEEGNPSRQALLSAHEQRESHSGDLEIDAEVLFRKLRATHCAKEMARSPPVLEACRAYLLSHFLTEGVAPGFPLFMSSLLYDPKRLLLVQERIPLELSASMHNPRSPVTWSHFRVQLAQLLYSYMVGSDHNDLVLRDWTTETTAARPMNTEFAGLRASFVFAAATSPDKVCWVFENQPVGKVGLWCVAQSRLGSLRASLEELQAFLPQEVPDEALPTPKDRGAYVTFGGPSPLELLFREKDLEEGVRHFLVRVQEEENKEHLLDGLAGGEHGKLLAGLVDWDLFPETRWRREMGRQRKLLLDGAVEDLEEDTFFQTASRSVFPFLITYVVDCLERFSVLEGLYEHKKEDLMELLEALHEMSPEAFLLGVLAAVAKRWLQREKNYGMKLAYQALLYFFPGFFRSGALWEFLNSRGVSEVLFDPERVQDGHPTNWVGRLEDPAVQQLLDEKDPSHLVFRYLT